MQTTPSGVASSIDGVLAGGGERTQDKVAEKPGEKKGKRDKDKVTKLVYSDDTVSPEEKMASLPRYAFVPSGKRESVLEDATTAAVTGVVTGPDDVLDGRG